MRAHGPQDHGQGRRRGGEVLAGQAESRGDDDPRRALQPAIEPVARQLQHLIGAVEHGSGPERLDPDELLQQGPGLVGLADRHDRQVMVRDLIGKRGPGVEINARDLHPAAFDHQLQRRVGHQIAGRDQHQQPQAAGAGLAVAKQPSGRKRQPLALHRPGPVVDQLEQGPQLEQPRRARRPGPHRGQPLLDQGRQRNALERQAHEAGRIGGRDRLERRIDADGGGHERPGDDESIIKSRPPAAGRRSVKTPSSLTCRAPGSTVRP